MKVLNSGPPIEECTKRPPSPAPDTVATLSQLRYRCYLAARPSGVVLTGAIDGSRPDPGIPFADGLLELPDGRFMSVSAYDPRPLIWNARGDSAIHLGAEGMGPGEFARRRLSLFLTPHDSVIIRDGLGRWLVYDRDLRFVRLFPSIGIPGVTVHVSERNEFIFTEPVPGGRRDAAFHVTEGEGRVLLSAGKSSTAGRGSYMRPSTYDVKSGGLWIAPAKGSGVGYVLEHWGLDGTLRQRLVRDVPWLPVTGYPDEPMAPDFKFLDVDSNGLLWVLVAVKDPDWRKRRGNTGTDASDDEQGDLRLEVLDPRAEEVLASIRIDSVSRYVPPVFPVGRGRRKAYDVVEDGSGIVRLNIHDLFLVEKSGRGRD